MNRTRIIEHYKNFHGILEITEECQIDIDWAESLIKDSCNGLPLQENRKKCSACGQIFTAKNKQQEFCSGKCRVRFHRVNTQLQKFNQKVKEIIRNEKFLVEQIITSEGKCPFVVYCNGEKYQSDNTKSLLCKIRKQYGNKLSVICL
ncbi:hypothetical protein QUH73_04375 [Labilibaculum sp. K2S]|uniref:hypothetical protein n=1 Tax=Labilibaculum sp. K2S TaxID=3056386 RepID=UPI0025A49CF7|nr:hypothetical protein [Labilibaculum sp. K2S]MDM8159051.1 hypothetical protein [Labilibaculum sp. K2S]